jgi:hypothetical protein
MVMPIPNEREEKSKWRQLFPLFLIFGYITTTAVLLNLNPFDSHGFMLDFMGLFTLSLVSLSCLILRVFRNRLDVRSVGEADFVVCIIYPFIETALRLMFLLRFEISIALYATLIVLGITTIGVTKVLLDKKSIQCACLGTALKLL